MTESLTKPVSPQYHWMVSAVASLGGFLFGFDTAVVSGTVALLRKQYSLTGSMEGWVVSCALYGCVLGALVAGILSDRFGRKKVFILAAILFLVSAIASAMPDTIPSLIVARSIGGVGVGIASMLSPLYLAELSPAAIRGRMVALYQLAIALGILCAHFSNVLVHTYAASWANFVGPYSERIFTEPWRAMFATEAIPAAMFLLLMFFVPESPRWLVLRKKMDAAKRILGKILGEPKASDEVITIEKAASEEEGTIWELFTPRYRIALIIGIFLPLFGQLSGINAIMYYGPSIFEKAGLQFGDSLGGQVVIGTINVLFTFIAILTVDRLGRRPLILIGTAGLLLSLLGCSLIYHFDIQSSILIVLPFALFVTFFAFSLGPLPWIVISEIFPNHVRGRAMSLGTFTIWTGCIIVTQSFPLLTKTFGVSTVFGLYFILLIPCIPFIYYLLPETKGKSLETIQAEWKFLN